MNNRLIMKGLYGLLVAKGLITWVDVVRTEEAVHEMDNSRDVTRVAEISVTEIAEALNQRGVVPAPREVP